MNPLPITDVLWSSLGIVEATISQVSPDLTAWIGDTANQAVQGVIGASVISRCSRALTSAKQLGKNHDVVKLMGDAARCSLQYWIENELPAAQLKNWPKRWSAEAFAAKLAREWEVLDCTSLLENCRSTDILKWFDLSVHPGAHIPSPLTLDEWNSLVSVVEPDAPDDISQEFATALHSKFTHYVRELFKQDAAKSGTNGGRAYAALELAISGSLLEKLESLASEQQDLDESLISIRAEVLALANRSRAVALELKAERQELVAWIGSTLHHVEQAFAVRDAPQLKIIPPVPDSETGRHVFWNERLSIVGRETEFKELWNFATQSSGMFRWDLWTGPGGSGKSRLALMLAKELQPAWHSGFYEWELDESVRWDLWQPTQPTLIVFDYASEHADRLGYIVGRMSRRAADDADNALREKVRFLLLDREIPRMLDEDDSEGLSLGEFPEPDWLRKFKNGIDAMDLARIAHYGMNWERPERPLQELDAEAIRAIICEDANINSISLSDAEIDARVNLVVKIDPQRRPLFAAYVAEVTRSTDRAVMRWSLDDLLREIVTRERSIWQRRCNAVGMNASEQARMVRLACVATMTGGLDQRQLSEMLGEDSGGCLPTIGEYDNDRYRQIVDSSPPGNAAKVEPDLIGAAFVLDELSRAELCHLLLVQAAARVGVDKFLVLAADGFPLDHRLTSLFGVLLEESGDIVVAAQKSRLASLYRLGERAEWRKLARSLLEYQELSLEDRLPFFAIAAADDSAEPRFVCDTALELNRLVDSVGASSIAIGGLGVGTVRAIFQADTDATLVDRLLNALKHLATKHPNNGTVQSSLAFGIGKAILLAGKFQEREMGLKEELALLALQRPGNDNIAVVLALTLGFAIAHSADNQERLDRLLDELRHLRKRYVDSRQVAKVLADSLAFALRLLLPQHNELWSILSVGEFTDDNCLDPTRATRLANEFKQVSAKMVSLDENHDHTDSNDS